MLLIKEINMQRGHNKAAKRILEAQVILMVWFVLAFRIVARREIAFNHPRFRAHSPNIDPRHAIPIHSRQSPAIYSRLGELDPTAAVRRRRFT